MNAGKSPTQSLSIESGKILGVDMTNKYKILLASKRVRLIVGCVVLCLILLREVGILDVSKYQSTLSTTFDSSAITIYQGKAHEIGFTMTLSCDGETIFARNYIRGDTQPIVVKAILTAPIYTGNTFLPFVKNFTALYTCEYSTVDSPTGHELSGTISGDIDASIIGLCTRRKAKALAFEAILKNIESRFETLGKG